MPDQRRAALSVTAALVLILGTICWRTRGPTPKPANAPGGEFSAVRALEAERATIGGRTPHPMGSAANRAVRDRIVARLESLGYIVNVQRAFACNAHANCGTVENIIAHAPGQPSGPSVALCAHYDSVFAGPGASDDGTGVAALLETARAVRSEKLRNAVTFLIDDGEEAGLLGAEGFVADRSVADPVAAVIDLEARGTSGPSALFETSSNNRWFLPLVANALPRPITTSLFYGLYELLPNDTDLTVFRRAGLIGVNFAYLKNVVWYHSPLDDIDHVDLRSLQHHGDNALASLRVLGNTDLRRTSTSNSVWFDVLGFFVVSWPGRWTLIAAIASLVLAILAASVLVREAQATWYEIFLGISAFVVAMIASAALAAFAILFTPRDKWIAYPQALVIAAWTVGIAVTIAIIAFARRRANLDATFVAMAIAWNVIAVVVTIVLADASYAFLIPGLALAIASTLRATGNGNAILLATICALIAAIIWFPFGVVLYDVLGRTSVVAIALILALVATTFAPLFARVPRALLIGALTIVVIGIAVTNVRPVATNDRPRRITLTYLDDGMRTQWIASSPVANVNQPERLFPWYGAVMPVYYFAPAPQLSIAPVVITREANSIRIRSQRNADRISLVVHATLPSIRVNGVTPPPASPRFRPFVAPGWTRVFVFGPEAVVDIGRSTPVEVYGMDYSASLPPEGRSLESVRDASSARTTDSGDITMTMRHTVL
jgi:hypothetical protein